MTYCYRVREGAVALDHRVSPRITSDADPGRLGDRSARDLVDHGGARHRTVFSLPGIGKLIVNGAANRDYTLVLGLVVLVTVVAVRSTCWSISRMRRSIRKSATEMRPAIENLSRAAAAKKPPPRRSKAAARGRTRVCASCATRRRS